MESKKTYTAPEMEITVFNIADGTINLLESGQDLGN